MPETTKERIIYHGAVLDRGDDFLGIDAYSGGYAPTVIVQIEYNKGTTTLNLSPEDAQEFARHLVAAAEVLPLNKSSDQSTGQRLREALRNLLDADRDFLGADNVCVYCGRHQRDEGHSANCVITKAMDALS